METLKEELANYKVGEEGWWVNRKKEFMFSVDFYDILSEHTMKMFEIDFDGAICQFQEVGHPPKGIALEFLDLQKIFDEILDDELGD